MKKTFYYLLISFTLFLSACQSQTTLKSDQIENKNQRIETLKKYVNVPSDIQDAEFDLFNVNGFKPANSRTGVPGASSMDYKFCVKVAVNDLDKWTNGITPTDMHDQEITWAEKLIAHKRKDWTTTSNPFSLYYINNAEGSFMIIYPEEGIVFKRIKNL